MPDLDRNLLRVGFDFDLPDLTGAVPQIASVVADPSRCVSITCWDTEDLALSRRGVSVSRRQSDAAEWWRITLDTGRVMSVPAGGGDPEGLPDEVRAVLADIVETGSVLPQILVTEHRLPRRLLDAEGRALGTVFDDLISAHDVHSGARMLSRRTLHVEGPAGDANDGIGDDTGDGAAGDAADGAGVPPQDEPASDAAAASDALVEQTVAVLLAAGAASIGRAIRLIAAAPVAL